MATVGPTTGSLLRGLVVLRWATLVWSAGVVVVSDDRLRRPWLAVLLLAAALVVTVVTTVVDWRARRHVGLTMLELAVGFALLALEGAVFEAGQAFAGRQGLAGGWPVVGVLAAGVTLGVVPGALAGLVVGSGRVLGALANGVRSFDADRVASLAATIAFYTVYGAVAGWVGRLLARAEEEVAMTRAREEVGRRLHDGVLQTLAVVERRMASADPALARLAADTDHDLRAYLAGDDTVGATEGRLASQLAARARTAARPFGIEVEMAVVDDGVVVAPRVTAALGAAVAEAVTNVGKHAGTPRAVVFVDRQEDGTVLVSVRDDGCGFDPAAPTARRGLLHSVSGRMAEVGGRADVVSAPDAGTEVRLWVP